MNQIFFLPLICLKGVNYKLEYLKSEVSHAGPRAPRPWSPTAGRGARPPLASAARLQEPGFKTQARDDPALLFKAIQLHQCTETALFNLNIKVYSFFFNFPPRGVTDRRVILNVCFF